MAAPQENNSKDTEADGDELDDIRANLIVTQMLKYAPPPKKKKRKSNPLIRQAKHDAKLAKVVLKKLTPALIVRLTTREPKEKAEKEVICNMLGLLGPE